MNYHFESSLFSIESHVESSQSKNCWLYVQLRHTAFYLWRFWNRDNEDRAWRIVIRNPLWVALRVLLLSLQILVISMAVFGLAILWVGLILNWAKY